METYDYIVIGGGSGGIGSANRAGLHGAKVLVIEADAIGGTCVNRGCVPKKIMWQAAQISHEFDFAGDYGLNFKDEGLDWQKLTKNREAYIKLMHTYYDRGLASNDVTQVHGYATIVGPEQVKVGDTIYTAPHILIATGAKPAVPAIPGIEYAQDSTGFFELASQPKRVAIIGSGYIATEMAGMLQQLGSQVDLFLKYEQLLPKFDAMLSQAVTTHYQEQGIRIHQSAHEERIVKEADGTVTLWTAEGGRHNVDAVVYAVGRVPNVTGFGLENVDVQLDEQGFIKVDQFQNTTAPGIYAVGDVTGNHLLTPVAIAAGRRLSNRLFAGESNSYLDYTNIPTIVFALPTIGTVGLTEQEAMAQYGDDAVTIYYNKFTPMFYGLSENPVKSQIKLVCVGPEQKIVGLHGFGIDMAEMLQGFAVAVKMGATKADFDSTVALHPTSAEEFVTMK
ncbi:glutathione-disulfide reductase [Lacticaseibacillus saniviri]